MTMPTQTRRGPSDPHEGTHRANRPVPGRPLFACIALVAVLAACGDGDREGGSCERCRDAQPRCDSGLTCKGFSNSITAAELCAAPSQTTCELR
jgi:hypothetical protein